MMDEDEWYDLKYQLENGDITEGELDAQQESAMSYSEYMEYVADINDMRAEAQADWDYEDRVYGPPNSPSDYGE